MKYENGFLSARLNDSDKNKKIGKEVEKGNCEFSHFAMDRCYYRPIRTKRDIAEMNEAVADELQGRKQMDTLDQAIEMQRSFISGNTKEI